MMAIFTIAVLFVELSLLALFNTSVPVAELSDTWVIVVILIFSVAYIFAIDKSKKMQSVKLPLLCGYILRIFLVFWSHYGRKIFILPWDDKDASGFYNNSVRYAQGQEIKYGVPFTTIMGRIFSFTGISKLLGQFLIALYSMVAIHMAALILEKVGVSEKAKQRSIYILCLLPHFAIMSQAFMRESLIIMCMALSAYCFVQWFYEKNELYFVAAFALVFCGAAFHAGVVGLAVGYIVIRVIYDGKREKMNLSMKGILFALLFLMVFVFLYNNYSDTLFGKVRGVEDISDIAQSYQNGGSDYSAYVGNSNNPLNLVIYTPIRMAYFLFSPFPWQWRGLEDIIAFCFSSMFYMWVVIQAIRRLRDMDKMKRSLVIALLILVFCAAFVFAWGVSNTGTAIRHRDKMVVLYAVLYGLATEKKDQSKRGFISEKL